jgi:hypothetical protein
VLPRFQKGLQEVEISFIPLESIGLFCNMWLMISIVAVEDTKECALHVGIWYSDVFGVKVFPKFRIHLFLCYHLGR